MKLRPLCLFILLIAAGCAEITAPPPPPSSTGGDLSAYFWPNQAMSYHYKDSSGVSQSIVTSPESSTEFTILESDGPNGLPIVLTASMRGFGASLSGLSDHTILALPPGAMVTDSIASSPTTQLHIGAIADLHSPLGSHSIFAATDHGLFAYSTKSDSLIDAHIPLPSATISSLYAGDNDLWYAVSDTDGHVYFSINDGLNWQSLSLPAGLITASTVGSDLFVAIDRVGIFRCEPSGATKLTSLTSDRIDALAAGPSRNELLLGTESGKIEHFNGSSIDYGLTLIDSNKVTAIERLFVSDNGSLYASTSTNVYLSTIPGWIRLPNLGSQVTDFWQDNGDVYYSTVAGSIFRSHDNQANVVSIVAAPLRTVVPTSGRKIALVGDSLFVSMGNYDKWSPVRISSSDTVWLPGGFQMLPVDASTSWPAGHILVGDRHQHSVLDYTGRLLDNADQIVLAGKTYADVAIVRYAIEINSPVQIGSSVDIDDGPEYVVFYQRGVGVIRIETTTAGLPTHIWQMQ